MLRFAQHDKSIILVSTRNHILRGSEGPIHSSAEHCYYVYILTNRSKTFYVGVTNNLRRRVWQHKQGSGSVFCAHYKIDRLVYFECFQYAGNAIAREKHIKGLLRMKKDRAHRLPEPSLVRSERGLVRRVPVPAKCTGPSLRSEGVTLLIFRDFSARKLFVFSVGFF